PSKHIFALRGLHQLDCLLHDLHAFTHLEHSDQVAVVAVTVPPHRNLEIHFRIGLVRLATAQVPCHAGAADEDSRETVRLTILGCDHTDIDVPLLEDAVLS